MAAINPPVLTPVLAGINDLSNPSLQQLPRIQWQIGGATSHVISERIDRVTRRFVFANYGGDNPVILAEDRCPISQPGKCVRKWSRAADGLSVHMFAYREDPKIVTYCVVLWTTENVLKTYHEKLTPEQYNRRLEFEEPGLTRSALPKKMSWVRTGTRDWAPHHISAEKGIIRIEGSLVQRVSRHSCRHQGFAQQADARIEDGAPPPALVTLNARRMYQIQVVDKESVAGGTCRKAWAIDPSLENEPEEISLPEFVEGADRVLALDLDNEDFIGIIDPSHNPPMLLGSRINPAETFRAFLALIDFENHTPSQIKSAIKARLAPPRPGPAGGIAAPIADYSEGEISVERERRKFEDLSLDVVHIRLSAAALAKFNGVMRLIGCRDARDIEQAKFRDVDVSEIRRELTDAAGPAGAAASVNELNVASRQGTALDVYISVDKRFGEIIASDGAPKKFYLVKQEARAKLAEARVSIIQWFAPLFVGAVGFLP